MTRDEAHAKVHGILWGEREDLINTLVALGLLKLDEPKSIKDRTREAFICSKWNPECASDLPLLLERVGLKIVEA